MGRKVGEKRNISVYDKLAGECARFGSARSDRLAEVCAACVYVCVARCPTVVSRPLQPLTFASACFCF